MMTLMDTLVICLMALGIVVWVAEPLLRRPAQQRPGDGERERERERTETLLMQKETLYTALRDLDFDFQTSKVDAHDYAELRQQLESDALLILREVDLVDPLARLDQEIEARIAALKDAQTLLAEQTSSSDCPHCRTALMQEAHFCPFCGRSLRS